MYIISHLSSKVCIYIDPILSNLYNHLKVYTAKHPNQIKYTFYSVQNLGPKIEPSGVASKKTLGVSLNALNIRTVNMARIRKRKLKTKEYLDTPGDKTC